MIKFGITGYPLKHSLSPLFWNLYFKRKNIKAFYERIELPPDREIDLRNYRGLNITTPWKEKILKYTEKSDEIVSKTENANTLFIDNRVIAYNTDFYGFKKLIEDVGQEFKKIVILGTGGSARTCAFYFKKRLLKNIVFLSRNKKEKIMGYDVKNYSLPETKEILKNSDLIINATPCGWEDKLPPLNIDYIKKAFLVDLHYGRGTIFLKEGKKRGLDGISGEKMLLYQAVHAGKIWLKDFDEECFKKCFEEVFQCLRF